MDEYKLKESSEDCAGKKAVNRKGKTERNIGDRK